MSGRSKPKAWITGDGDFLGVSGVYSLDEMAQVIAADEWVAETLNDEVPSTAPASIRAWLDKAGVRAIKVPARWLHEERWPDEIPWPIDAKPGRGYVKVLGVSL